MANNRCRVVDFVQLVQDRMGDPRGVRYTDARVLASINLGIGHIAFSRPEQFLEKIRVKLKPGNSQDFCDVCDNPVKYAETEGREDVEPKKQTTKDQERTSILDFHDVFCESLNPDTGTESFAVFDYVMDAKTPCTMRIVGDGVPTDKDYYGYISCMNAPCNVCMEDDIDPVICNKFSHCLMEFVLADIQSHNLRNSASVTQSQAAHFGYLTACLNRVASGMAALERDYYYINAKDTE